ncbi:MAG TPA: hypothetical protein VFN92_08175 [Solirubrobacterales bacterium]|nr:hypothetical protein [Solirubrobacterales bacterium]
MTRVLIVGDHPHRGKCGKLISDDVVQLKDGWGDMVKVELDEVEAGVDSCYVEARNLQPVTNSHGREASR